MLTLKIRIMRQNVDFGKKQKPGMIFFQIGLIAVMVVVLFALEFRFEKITREYKPGSVTITDEQPFSFDPSNIIKEERRAEKVVAKVMPRPVDFHEVEVKKDEVEIEEPKEENSKEDVGETVESTAESGENKTESQNNTIGKEVPQKTGLTVLTVEELPAFPACKGLPRNEQMQCFEEQLRKAVSKNLTYPEEDYKEGRQGVALVEFTINEEGEFSNIKILDNKRATPDMMKAAEKAIKKLRKINPAKQGNTPVKVKYTLPIAFKIK